MYVKKNNLKPLEFNEMVKNSAFAALDIFKPYAEIREK